MKILIRISAVLSSLLCLTGGGWILYHAGFGSDDDVVWTGIGLYFLGKGFFVGPMLLVAGEKLGSR